jgi:murein DD-endopeptidase MepM/ murein hydrolase activator NlpD
VPAAIGVAAVVTAAVGAFAFGGPGATSSYAAGSTSTAATAGQSQHTPSAAIVAMMRSQERIERGTQREKYLAAAADADARAAAELSELDTVTGDRVARFAGPTYTLPVTDFVVTSHFGPRGGSVHTGIDLAVPWGTPIHAISSGEIIFAQRDGGCGLKTIIQQDDGAQVWYCHQSRFALTSGRVETGQLIGYVGSTGNSTGPHVHVEVHPGAGDAVNPRTWMEQHGLDLG